MNGENAKISFHIDDIPKIKREIIGPKPYADRVSFAFVIRLLQARQVYESKEVVLSEIDFLEGITTKTKTKPATQFKREPLHPFWHKHVFAARHIIKNIGAEWGFEFPESNHGKYSKHFKAIAQKYEGEEGTWINPFVNGIVDAAINRPREARATGDWIIFAKLDGKNIYLDLATHEEGQANQKLYEKLRDGCKDEFPYLFYTST